MSIFKNQQGMAMFVAIMMLTLGSSFALLAWQVSSTELEISRFSASEGRAYFLAESGIDKVISWIGHPENSPDPSFFENLPTTACSQNAATPDRIISPAFLTNMVDGPFKSLKEMGKITELYFYKASREGALCTVGVLAEARKGGQKRIEVELGRNPLGALRAGIQGQGNPGVPSPVWLHWGKIRYTGSANLGNEIKKVPKGNTNFTPTGDGSPYTLAGIESNSNEDHLMEVLVENHVIPALSEADALLRPNVHEIADVGLDEISSEDLDAIKRFIKEHGEAYVLSQTDGMLEDHQGNVKSFHDLFGPDEVDQPPNLHLAWIETNAQSSHEPLKIEGGPYRGYFYFPEGVDIEINHWDGSHLIDEEGVTPPPRVDGTSMLPVDLGGLNLVGFFYVRGEAKVQDDFKTFGALYAEEGFSGSKAGDLEVWYNPDFATSSYAGVRPVTPLPGTWKTPPVDPL